MKPEQAPKRIFLQNDDYDHASWDSASWCEDSINDGDVEYIRADLARPTPSPLESIDILDLAKALKSRMDSERIETYGFAGFAATTKPELFESPALPSPAAPLEWEKEMEQPLPSGSPSGVVEALRMLDEMGRRLLKVVESLQDQSMEIDAGYCLNRIDDLIKFIRSLPQAPVTHAAAPVERAKERITYKPGLGLVGE